MDSLYTPEVRAVFKSKRWPEKLKIEIVEDDEVGVLYFRMYRLNINALSHDDKMHMAGLLNDALTQINKMGIPARTWVEAGHGPQPTQGG